MPKHFAFVAPPAHGHVNPSLPLVEELVARGHRVTYATGEGLISKVEAAGAEGLGLSTQLPSQPPGPGVEFTPELLAGMMRYFVDDARESFPKLVSHFEQDRPDAVCYDMMTFTGRMLADKLDVPEVTLVPNFAANEQFSLHETFIPDSFDHEHPALLETGAELERFAAEYGVAKPQPMFQTVPAPLNLVFIPEQFQLEAETFDERFRFLGPSLGRRAHAESWQPADAEAPLLFISLGTVFHNRPDFYRVCLRAFADSPWQVAMAIGDHIDVAELGETPPNFEVRARFPQPAVLEHATAFLSHTGMNSTMEALYYGVPLAAYPQMPEQEANAHRVVELGLGHRLDDEVTAEELRKAVDDLAADQHVRTNVTAMSTTLHGSGGAAAGADALEAHLS
ncbi:MGT family glycosyltransferase [Saccharopolyspora lacisalsi]|uniref:MGT family glycosyltransferase n=1 Tax=Halosaccharopolyspora lacisalsi TaxID=1000566 RepID=A0A839DUJ1_9PSEU|nr:macrolide family glycosyltransferase [Halosaccharopolyspora lacisalsi]MBA8824713.1 MGT family glycosyltransferase [Halosaccharopolyspora lacisalsi]